MNREQQLLSLLYSKWKRLLRVESAVPRPGFIGSVPYLLLLRWLIFVGIGLRFTLFWDGHVGSPIPVLASIGMTGMLALAATYITLRPTLRRSRRIQSLLIASDILLVSILYFLTENPQSDLFLFYYLPLLTATAYLGHRALFIVPAAITGAFAFVLVLLFAKDPDPSLVADLFFRVFLSREVFFLSVFMLSSYLHQLERTQKEKLSQRETELRTLLYFKEDVDQLFDVDQVLERTVHRAVKIVGATGAHISLVNYETGQLELKSYTPQDYLKEERVLATGDGLARQVTQQRRSCWLEDVQSDPALSSVFGLRTHSLLCVPIMAHKTVLGTLSVGGKMSDHLDDSTERFVQALAGHVASAIERARLLTALCEIGGATASTLELDHELDTILQELTDTLRFEFASVSLVDDYRQTIQMVRGKNVPSGWIRRSTYDLDSTDILADIVRTGKTEVIEEWDERFNEEIYERFGHADLVRVFTPLVADGVPIGTIEAGCRRERWTEMLTDANIQAVERLGRERGAAVARTRSYVLLELIANHAIRIIGADSASIHVYHFGQRLLEAGAGKATKDFLLRFPPREGGIGQQAMQTGKSVVIDRPQDLAVKHSALHDEGVRAIAVFPLSLGADIQGVLYVHFWREHRFSQAELELEQVFARQMVIVIQNNLLLKSIADAAQRAWALAGFQSIIQSLVSSFNLAQVLEEVARNVMYMLDADNVTLYQYSQGDERFTVPPVMKGSFQDRGAMQTQMHPDDIVWEIVRQGQSRFISDVPDEPRLFGTRSDGVDRPRFVEREEVKSSAVMVLRAGETNEIVGLMFVNYRTPRSFEIEDQKTINALASSAAIAIETARLYERVRQDLIRRDKELEALRAVDRAIVASPRVPELQQILEFILDKGLEIIEAPIGVIMWLNRWENVLELRAQRGVPEDQRPASQNIGEGVVGLAAERREVILIPDVTAEEWSQIYKEVVPSTRSELAVPLVDESGLLGVFNLEHPEAGAFNEDDKSLLETLAVQAVIAIHTVDLYQKLERQIRSLHSLSTIATRIQDVTYELDTVLRLLLTGVTSGEGLGFSRAMLFLTDDEETKLQGRMAIGACARQEAEATWERLDEEARSLKARGEDVLTSLLNQTEQFSIAVAQRGETDWPLNTALQGVCIPIERGAGALSVCVLEGKPAIVADTQPDPFREIIEQVTQPGDTGHAFACVPLVGKGRIIGALVVDNRFLTSEREVDEGAISCLEAFAGMIAMSIENARLQTRLAEEQRLATWKKFTARIAHIIGTRISVIKDTVTQLRFGLLEEGGLRGRLAEETRVYLEELASGIYKAEMVLRDFRQFAQPLQLQLQELDLTQVIRTVLQDMRHGIDFPIELDWPDQPLTIQGDADELFHAFAELIGNAQEAMQQDTSRLPLMTITAGVEAATAGPGSIVRVEFVNTGPGIPEVDKDRIFEPFFSTKGRGSGLGLAIVRDIIEEHEGTIKEIGMPEAGARFVVLLPLLEQKAHL